MSIKERRWCPILYVNPGESWKCVEGNVQTFDKLSLEEEEE